MLGGVRDRQAGSARQNLHRALALSKLFQQFEAMGMAQCLRDCSELGEQRLFGTERCIGLLSRSNYDSGLECILIRLIE